jgi:superkiller protein 3
MREEKDLFQVWKTIDVQIGNAKDESLLQTLTALRDQYEQEIRTGEIERLHKIFKRNPESGWKHWLRTYSKALANWKLSLAFSLAEESFQFPLDKDHVVEKIKRSTNYMLHERWPETYDVFMYLAEQTMLPKVLRAKMYVTAGEIQLYQLMKPNKARELFQRAENLAPNEGRVICGWGEYWLQQNKIDKAKRYFERTIKIAPFLGDGYTKMAECFETQGDLGAAKEWYEEAVKTAGAGYNRLLRLYGWPDLFEDEKERKRIPYHVERAIALDPEGEYSIYEEVGNIYKRNKQYKEALRWYQKVIRFDSTRMSGYIAKGYTYLDRELVDYKKARINFQKAIEVGPEAFDGYWGLTWLYEGQGQWEKALKWYKESLLRRPEWEAMIRAKMGEMHWRLQMYSEAEEQLVKSLRIEPDNEMASRTLDNLADDYYMKHEDSTSALRVYNEIRKIKGRSYEGEFQNHTGNVYYYFGKYEDAVEAYRKAIAVEPETAVYHSNLGGAYRERGDLYKAKKAFKKAIGLEPNNVSYLNRLGRLFYQMGDYENAIDCHTKAIEINQKVPVSFANLGLAFRDVGKRKEAIKAYRAAITIEPDNADYHNGLGIVFYWSGDFKKSIDCYKKAIERSPQVAVYHANLGLALRDLKKWKEAEKAYSTALKLEPTNAEYQNMLGNVYFGSGGYEKSIQPYRKAIENDPKVPVYHANLGGSYRALERWKEAEKAYRTAIELESNNAEYQTMLGNIYFESGDYERSLGYYTKAIEIDSKVAVYHGNLGGSYRALGRWKEAEEAYSAAIELEPDNAQHHDMLGYVYYESGDYDRAAEKCSDAIRINPGVPTYASHLILACGQIDNPDKAISLLESASKYNPDNIDFIQAIERFKKKGEKLVDM